MGALVLLLGMAKEVSGHGWKAEAGREGACRCRLATHRSLWQGGLRRENRDKGKPPRLLPSFCSLFSNLGTSLMIRPHLKVCIATLIPAFPVLLL